MLLTLYKGTPLFNHHSHLQHQVTTDSIDHTQSISKLSSLLTTRKARWASGSLALVAGTVLWSSWFLVQSNIGKKYPLQYSSTAIMMFFGAIQSFALSLSVDRDLSSWILKGKLEVFSILYAVSQIKKHPAYCHTFSSCLALQLYIKVKKKDAFL